jgi:caa(3)-type oxidase subunit IV
MAGHGPKHYIDIWKKLLVLLILSVIGPEIGIQVVTLITAFGIAVIKAYMVAKYFMHIDVERKFIHYILITGITFMLIFYYGVAPDIMKHEGQNWSNTAAKAEVIKQMKFFTAKPKTKFDTLREAQQNDIQDKTAGQKDLWKVKKGRRVIGYYNSKELADKVAKEHKASDPEITNKMQVPIAHAMKLVIADGAKSFPLPPPEPMPEPAAGTEVVAAVVPATPPAPFEVNVDLATKGKALFTSKTCSACHSIDGSRLVGPTMKGIWGRKEKLTDGSSIYVNKAYFVQSIKDPMSQIVEGYPPGMAVMQLTDEEIDALLNYVASL